MDERLTDGLHAVSVGGMNHKRPWMATTGGCSGQDRDRTSPSILPHSKSARKPIHGHNRNEDYTHGP